MKTRVVRRRGLVIISGLTLVSAIFALLSPVFAGTQATYYVSPAGSDDNPGTISAPFLTITAAQDSVRSVTGGMSGDIQVILRGGISRGWRQFRLEAEVFI